MTLFVFCMHARTMFASHLAQISICSIFGICHARCLYACVFLFALTSSYPYLAVSLSSLRSQLNAQYCCQSINVIRDTYGIQYELNQRRQTQFEASPSIYSIDAAKKIDTNKKGKIVQLELHLAEVFGSYSVKWSNGSI